MAKVPQPPSERTETLTQLLVPRPLPAASALSTWSHSVVRPSLLVAFSPSTLCWLTHQLPGGVRASSVTIPDEKTDPWARFL